MVRTSTEIYILISSLNVSEHNKLARAKKKGPKALRVLRPEFLVFCQPKCSNKISCIRNMKTN